MPRPCWPAPAVEEALVTAHACDWSTLKAGAGTDGRHLLKLLNPPWDGPRRLVLVAGSEVFRSTPPPRSHADDGPKGSLQPTALDVRGEGNELVGHVLQTSRRRRTDSLVAPPTSCLVNDSYFLVSSRSLYSFHETMSWRENWSYRVFFNCLSVRKVLLALEMFVRISYLRGAVERISLSLFG